MRTDVLESADRRMTAGDNVHLSDKTNDDEEQDKWRGYFPAALGKKIIKVRLEENEAARQKVKLMSR
jgi:hypothetical protein